MWRCLRAKLYLQLALLGKNCMEKKKKIFLGRFVLNFHVWRLLRK